MQNKLPQFEANQVLSNVHLNQFVEYLEEQGRLTRNQLLGAGIVSGLDVKRDAAATVSIYEGAGVTSAGYLVIPDTVNWPAPDEKGRRFIKYDRRKKYEPKNILSPYTGDFESVTDSYSLFNGTTNEIFLLIESLAPPTTDTNVKGLITAELNDHVIILFFEIKVRELKNCEGEDCIEFGKEIGYKVLPLLVSKTDADIILKNESALSSSLDGAAAINLAWQMSDIIIPKPDLTAVDGNFIKEELANIYAKVIGKLSKRLTEIGGAIDNSLKKILNTTVAPIADFQKKLNDLLTSTAVEKNSKIYQYVYDFACDYAAAYRELQDAVSEFASYEVPSSGSYPCHIRLGEVPAVNAVTSSYNFPPSVYRHTFVNARNVERQRKAFHSIQILFARLSALIENFKPDVNKEDIRITPSAEPGLALSDKAIPFYYKQDDSKRSAVLPVWNSEWNRQGKLDRILNYFTNANTSTREKFNDGLDAAKDHPSFFPLMYNHDSCNFYRVEGYSGQQLGDVFSELKTYINHYNLPFDLQLVGLNKNTQLAVKEMRLKFNDLDSMYNVMCEEVLCLLTTELNYFKNIRITRRIFTATPIAPAATIATLEDDGESLTRVNIPLASTFFFKTERQKQATVSKASAKMVQTLNLGIKDSTADITEKLGARVPTRDLGNIIGTIGTRFIPTPASPYILKLIASIEKLIDTLREDFDEFDSNDYKESLRAMHNETKEFITFVKPQSIESLGINSNMDRDESLGYLERLLYECDFEKIPAIDDERDKREKELGFNNNLAQYILKYPGLEHKAGVWKNGTLVIVFDRSLQVIADFCLPYRCCGGMNSTQYVLGVIQTLWFDGQVLDKDGAPVEKAKVNLNGEDLVVDKNGRFRKIIPPNTFLVLKVSGEGFEPTEVSITSGNDNVSHTVTLLKKTEIPKVTLKIKVTDSAGNPINEADIKADDQVAKTNNSGQATMQVRANAVISLSITKQGFASKNETITTQTSPLADLDFILVKIIKLSGAITDFNNQPVLNAKVLIDDKLVTVKENKYETELEDSHSYKMIVDAPGLQKFTDDVVTEFTDINKPVQLQRIKTQTVRVGIYISPEPVRQPTPQPQPTSSGGVRMVERNRGAAAVTGAGALFNAGARRRATEFEAAELFVDRGATTRTPTPPATPPDDKFSLMNNSSTSSSIDDKLQRFNDNLRVFESQERMSPGHTLLVRDALSSMEFASMLTVGDHDMLVLIHSARGKRAEIQISLLISNATGVNTIARFNEIMSSALGLPGTQQLATGNTIELRMFTRSDESEIRQILKRNGIPIAQENSFIN
jgi:protocatechuate 3,4-dioxygenase beta subunit